MMNMQRGMMMYAMILIVTLGGGLAPLMGADIVWTNTAGGAWLEPGNWLPYGTPQSDNNAYLTNNFDSYVVNYDTKDVLFPSLTVYNAGPGTTTFNVNGDFSFGSGRANHVAFLLDDGGVVNVNEGAKFHFKTRETAVFASRPSMKGDFHVWGEMSMLNVGSTGAREFESSFTVYPGGTWSMADNGRYIFQNGAQILVKEGGTWILASSAGDFDLGGLVTAVATNRGRAVFNRSSVRHITIGRRGKGAFHQEAGSLTLNENAMLCIGRVFSWDGAPNPDGLFKITGGVVTNRSMLYLATSDHQNTRTITGELRIHGGTFLNPNPAMDIVVGGYIPLSAVSTSADIGNYGSIKAYITQTAGVFSAQGTMYIANGPSQGFVTIEGGSFYMTNATSNATMIVGAQSPGASYVGTGTLTLAGGTLRVDRLVATNGMDHSKIEFDGGTLETAGTEVDNGAALVVGDGTSTAVLNLLSGTHAFAGGLTINTNATLTVGGTNTIGSATLDGDLTLSEDARLAWAFEDGDPDALTVTGTVTLPASANVELNALDASNPTSIPLMTATGGFTGSPFDWPAVDVGGTAYHFRVQGDTLLAYIPSGTLIIIR